MLSFDPHTMRRGLLAMLLMLSLSACGFEPAYGPQGVATKLQLAVAFDAPADKNGFDLVERLEERLGRSKSQTYSLSYTIRTQAIGVGITPENAILRYNVIGSIDYVLRNTSSSATLAVGRVESFTSYGTTGTNVSTLSAERDALSRLMRLLADQIVTRLIATSADWSA